MILQFANNQYVGDGACVSVSYEGVEYPVINIEVTEEVYNDFKEDNLRYVVEDDKLVPNPNYEADKKAREKAIIQEYRMTPLDFLKAIEKYGVTYDMVKAYMEKNPLIERELRFCQFVYRKHPMLNQLEEYGITDEVLDNIFKEAHSEEEL